MDFMAPYNSYEPQCKQRESVYFTKKENKTITVKKDIIPRLLHCSEGCHHLVFSLVIFLNTESW